MSDKIVLVFSGQGGNDAIRGLMSEFGDSLISIGMNVVHVTRDPAELKMAVEYATSGMVAFGLTYLGVGQDLEVAASSSHPSRNLWEAFQIPLLKVHGDIPAYYSERHSDTPATAVNLYVAKEFMQFRQRWLPTAHTLAGVIPAMPLFEAARSTIDLGARRGQKLVFVKNGNSPAELLNLWSERLPKSIARLLADIADAAISPGLLAKQFLIGDFVADFLTGRDIDPESAVSLVHFFTAQIDDYLRRVKSELIANAILDLPVVVQGGNWGHVDFTNRRAQLVPGQGYEETRKIFTDALGVIDMSPNTQGAPHERIWRAAGCYTLALTNRQSWLEQHFSGFSELAFNFDTGSIRDRIADVTSHPDRYLEMGDAFGEAFRRVYPKDAFANRVVDFAELAVLKYSIAKPPIQPYFVWPKTEPRRN